MSGVIFRPDNWLQAMRARGAARLLLLAFALQLAVPLFDLGGVAALAGEAALRADLQSSLCHDGNADRSPEPLPGSSQVKHCIFCLPLAGDPAATGIVPQAPTPTAAAVVAISSADDQVPPVSRPAFARSRAPPSPPRTV
jgi:hypothetical protein